ncbi:hypothetical protein QTO34_015449, partial [Cnephaeus nilssonii]
MAQTLSSRWRWRLELSVSPAQSATPATPIVTSDTWNQAMVHKFQICPSGTFTGMGTTPPHIWAFPLHVPGHCVWKPVHHPGHKLRFQSPHPMYFFLSNLSLVDICFTSTTIPKMLVNIQTQSRVITYEGCITQIYFYTLFVVLDNLILTVMAYDRFVAICQPLHYMVIMNPRLCGLLIVSCICGIPSAQGKYKAFSTCASHLLIVSLFYGTCLGVYFSSAATQNAHSTAIASVMYTVVTPMLNPFIYSLRNNDIKGPCKDSLA